MTSRFSSPTALVVGLHNRDEEARGQLHAWMREPLRRLVQELHTRHRLPHTLDRLMSHALHAAETYLRMRSPQEFAPMSEAAFRAALLLQVARQLLQPFGQGSQTTSYPEPLPETQGYSCQTVYLPFETIGSFRFGGDWYGGRRDPDGTLWIMVADVTGHGYAAYILANGLPAVWRRCWTDPQLLAPSPGEVLAVLHELLAGCLPEDVYVECTLLRLDPNGEATVAPAGGSRLFLRRCGVNRPELLKLRGLWLGFEKVLPVEEHHCNLEVGDELLLGSDGVFDQLQEYGGRDHDLVQLVLRTLPGRGLHEAVLQVLDRALQAAAQKDDITFVTVQRQAPTSAVRQD